MHKFLLFTKSENTKDYVVSAESMKLPKKFPVNYRKTYWDDATIVGTATNFTWDDGNLYADISLNKNKDVIIEDGKLLKVNGQKVSKAVISIDYVLNNKPYALADTFDLEEINVL